MDKKQCLEIKNLTPKQKSVITRWFWTAERKGTECKLSAAQTEEDVISMVNASFRNNKENTENTSVNINLHAMTVDQLEKLLSEIPAVIEQKKQEEIASIDEQIKALMEKKKSLTK